MAELTGLAVELVEVMGLPVARFCLEIHSISEVAGLTVEIIALQHLL